MELESPIPTIPLFDSGFDEGIYFGLPEEDYHAIPALSSSGIKNLMVSPMDFWVRSWMNPWREEVLEETEAKTIGKAYHKRILEGREAFNAAYAPEFECNDPGALRTLEDLRSECESRGIKKSGNKPELVARLRDEDPSVPIYDDLKQAYIDLHEGKTLLNQNLLRKIEISASMIEYHNELKYYFVGGYPEVSVVWLDRSRGIWFKSRFDYLKLRTVNDLKTFTNMGGKSIERAVYGEMASRRYHIQAALYLNAVEISKIFVQDGKVFDKVGVDSSWLGAFSKSLEHQFNFVFQQKGPSPVAVGAIFDRRDQMFDAGVACIESAADSFMTNLMCHGKDEPWVDMRDPIMLNWAQYPAFANDF
ncbi:hypothetical protein EBX93_17600 [bacterium]|nr:hypothetical protein [bacterium]